MCAQLACTQSASKTSPSKSLSEFAPSSTQTKCMSRPHRALSSASQVATSSAISSGMHISRGTHQAVAAGSPSSSSAAACASSRLSKGPCQHDSPSKPHHPDRRAVGTAAVPGGGKWSGAGRWGRRGSPPTDKATRAVAEEPAMNSRRFTTTTFYEKEDHQVLVSGCPAEPDRSGSCEEVVPTRAGGPAAVPVCRVRSEGNARDALVPMPRKVRSARSCVTRAAQWVLTCV